MTIQDIRVTVAAELDAIKPDGWQVSHDTRQKIHSGLIHVGHATNIQFASYGAYSFDLYVTAWVNEGVTVEAATNLYRLVSPGPESILSQWWQTTATNPGLIVVETVGQTPEGPTRFLAAVIRIPMTAHS